MRIIDAVARAQNTLDDPKMERIDPPNVFSHPPGDEGPQFNPMMRCSLPFLNSSSDNLRAFYRESIPQYRFIPPGQS